MKLLNKLAAEATRLHEAIDTFRRTTTDDVAASAPQKRVQSWISLGEFRPSCQLSVDALAAAAADLGRAPTEVEAAAVTEAALNLGAGPRSSPFARVQVSSKPLTDELRGSQGT